MSEYSNRENKEEMSYCSRCNQITDEILMLTCDHNLCLPCSAKTLFKDCDRITNSKLGSNYHSIQCEICGNFTALDPSTVEELATYKQDSVVNTPARIKVL
jgi:hypothetical protein